MTVTEKAAYLKGVVSMLKLEENSDEAKVLNVLVDTIDEMAQSIAELEEQLDLTNEQLDAVDEDLDDLEEYVYGDDDDDCCCDDDDMYEVECPSCGETVYFDGAAIEDGSAECPNCGAKLDFDLDGCDCDDCGHEELAMDVCPKCGRTEDAHNQPFERIRRITGYLVGTLDRFNNAKRAEERDRVKHA